MEDFLEFSKAVEVPEADVAIMGAVLREEGRLNEVFLSPDLFFQEIYFRSIDCI